MLEVTIYRLHFRGVPGGLPLGLIPWDHLSNRDGSISRAYHCTGVDYISFRWKTRFFLQSFSPFSNHWECLLDIVLSSSTKPPSNIFLLHARCWSHAFTVPSSTTVHPYTLGKFKMIPSITLVLQSKSVRQGLILWTISVRGSSILLRLS